MFTIILKTHKIFQNLKTDFENILQIQKTLLKSETILKTLEIF